MQNPLKVLTLLEIITYTLFDELVENANAATSVNKYSLGMCIPKLNIKVISQRHRYSN